MQDAPNIMNRRRSGLLRNTGMVIAGFASMVAGLCLGSYIAVERTDRAPVQGTRRDMVLRMAYMGPRPLRQAAMAVMSDGVVTVREEHHLYVIADQIRSIAVRARRTHDDDDATMSRRRGREFI